LHLKILLNIFKPLSLIRLSGLKIFNKIFKCNEYGLVASIDYVIDNKGQVIPIELKVYEIEKPYTSHEYQVIFQALVISFLTGKALTKAYIYYVESNKLIEVKITDDKKIHVLNLVLKIRKLIQEYQIPEVRKSSKCKYCQFRNICP